MTTIDSRFNNPNVERAISRFNVRLDETVRGAVCAALVRGYYIHQPIPGFYNNTDGGLHDLVRRTPWIIEQFYRLARAEAGLPAFVANATHYGSRKPGAGYTLDDQPSVVSFDVPKVRWAQPLRAFALMMQPRPRRGRRGEQITSHTEMSDGRLRLEYEGIENAAWALDTLKGFLDGPVGQAMLNTRLPVRANTDSLLPYLRPASQTQDAA